MDYSCPFTGVLEREMNLLSANTQSYYFQPSLRTNGEHTVLLIVLHLLAFPPQMAQANILPSPLP